MPANLEPIPFTKNDLAAVADFDCGDASWAKYVSAWIKGGPGGVLEALEAGTKVWLYVNAQDQLVGYGSLGTTEWYYPDPYGSRPDSKRVTLGMIPAYAVQKVFQKKPDGDWKQHYSSEILRNLITKAQQQYQQNPGLIPALGLFVEDQNLRAIHHYENHGFKKYGKPLKGGRQRMLLHFPEDGSDTSATQQQALEVEQTVSRVVNAPSLPKQQTKKAPGEAQRSSNKHPRHRNK